MKIGQTAIVFYNNWLQWPILGEEFIIFNFDMKVRHGIFHFGIGLFGFGVEIARML